MPLIPQHLDSSYSKENKKDEIRIVQKEFAQASAIAIYASSSPVALHFSFQPTLMLKLTPLHHLKRMPQ
jgi:hypothetical protein